MVQVKFLGHCSARDRQRRPIAILALPDVGGVHFALTV